MTNETKIKLSVEEALDFQRFESELRGFLAGAQSMAEHVKRMKVMEILASRKEDAPNGGN